MKTKNIVFDSETETFESGELIVDFTVSLSNDVKKPYIEAVKEAKKNGEPEPDAPKGVNVPATAVITLAGHTLEDVLEYVPKPRIISLQNSLKNAPNAEVFDENVRDKTFTLPAVAERGGTKDPAIEIQNNFAKLSKEEKRAELERLQKMLESE